MYVRTPTIVVLNPDLIVWLGILDFGEKPVFGSDRVSVLAVIVREYIQAVHSLDLVLHAVIELISQELNPFGRDIRPKTDQHLGVLYSVLVGLIGRRRRNVGPYRRGSRSERGPFSLPLA
jgi:hypothetical protein